MSAYIVENKCINRIVGFIHAKAMSDDSDFRWMLSGWTQEGYQITQDEDVQRLAEDMYKLNCEGVDARYGEGEHKEFNPAGFKYEHIWPGYNLHQIIKSIHCFLYQCSEGDISRDTRPIYRLLDDLSYKLCYHIVSRTPEYDKAVWG